MIQKAKFALVFVNEFRKIHIVLSWVDPFQNRTSTSHRLGLILGLSKHQGLIHAQGSRKGGEK